MTAAHAMRGALGAGAVAAALGALMGWTPLAWAGCAMGFTLAPGVAAARLLGPADRPALHLARAAFLGPLLAGALATISLTAGLSPTLSAYVVLYAAYVSALGVAFKGFYRFTAAPRWERRLLVWLAVLLVVALLPHALREWVRYRSDAWFHTAVALEVLARGLPPGDPYFAGFSLNYAWFYHGLVALWSRAAGVWPWDVGGALNAAWLVSLSGGAYALSRRAGRPGHEAFFAAVFVPLGASAFFWLGFPLKLVRGLVGETAGPDEVARLFSLRPFGFNSMWHVTSWWGSPPPLLNKYWVMTALGGAVTALIWWCEALVAIARRREGLPWRPLLSSGLATGALWVWHPALALAALLAATFAGGWVLVFPGSLGRLRVAVTAAALGAGTLAALPVLLRSVSRAEGPFPLGISPAIPALLAGSAAALLLGAPAIQRLRNRPAPRMFRVLALALMAATLFIVLPDPNTRDKMPFVFYLLPATAAGWMLGRWWRAWGRRGSWRSGLRWVGLGAILLPINALYLAVYLGEPAPPTPGDRERELYAWLAESTPPHAVVLDTAERDDVLVRVPRRQYWGREPYALQWGYPVAEMDARRRVRDLLVPRGAPPALPREAYDPVWQALSAFARRGTGPLYVVWRPGDHDGVPAAATPLAKNPHWFEQVFHNPAATVYRQRQHPVYGDEP